MKRKPKREPFAGNAQPNANAIQMFVHCALCFEEMKGIAQETGRVSPRDYARLSVGWTKHGLQVWCNRHEVNCVHIDFEGCTHPADTTRNASETPTAGGSDATH